MKTSMYSLNMAVLHRFVADVVWTLEDPNVSPNDRLQVPSQPAPKEPFEECEVSAIVDLRVRAMAIFVLGVANVLIRRFPAFALSHDELFKYMDWALVSAAYERWDSDGRCPERLRLLLRGDEAKIIGPRSRFKDGIVLPLKPVIEFVQKAGLWPSAGHGEDDAVAHALLALYREFGGKPPGSTFDWAASKSHEDGESLTERAAILEFDAGRSRDSAERLALCSAGSEG